MTLSGEREDLPELRLGAAGFFELVLGAPAPGATWPPGFGVDATTRAAVSDPVAATTAAASAARSAIGRKAVVEFSGNAVPNTRGNR